MRVMQRGCNGYIDDVVAILDGWALGKQLVPSLRDQSKHMVIVKSSFRNK